MATPPEDVDEMLVGLLGDQARSSLPSLLGTAASSGTRWTAKQLRTETASARQAIPSGQASIVIERLSDLLTECTTHSEGAATMVRGIIGSGFGGMNPAVVMAVVDDNAGTVSVAAYAKEGLIKQKTARKAVAKVMGSLPD